MVDLAAVAGFTAAGVAALSGAINVAYTALLARRSELQRWRRDHVLSAVADFLEISANNCDAIRDEAEASHVVINAGSISATWVMDAVSKRNAARATLDTNRLRLDVLHQKLYLLGRRQ